MYPIWFRHLVINQPLIVCLHLQEGDWAHKVPCHLALTLPYSQTAHRVRISPTASGLFPCTLTSYSFTNWLPLTHFLLEAFVDSLGPERVHPSILKTLQGSLQRTYQICVYIFPTDIVKVDALLSINRSLLQRRPAFTNAPLQTPPKTDAWRQRFRTAVNLFMSIP